jgi:hypothetical protein
MMLYSSMYAKEVEVSRQKTGSRVVGMSLYAYGGGGAE